MRSANWVAYLLLEDFYISAALYRKAEYRGMGKTWWRWVIYYI